MTVTSVDSAWPELCRTHFGPARAAFGNVLGGMAEIASARAWVDASDGRRYLDFGGYGVFLLGHRHPAVIAAVRRQLDLHPMSSRVFFEPVALRAAAALTATLPGELSMVQFTNSGSEATEAALKLARANGKSALISARNGFHGKTLGALSVTANEKYQRAFRPLLPHVTEVPFGDIPAMAAALAAVEGVGCVVIEPVQGEGGVHIPPDGYLREVAELCRRHRALLVVDEIQTGLGRLGSWWGIDSEGVVPDIVLAGKGLSGGVVPIAAMVADPRTFAPFANDPYLHTSTFAASPIACAAAIAALETMTAEDLPRRAADLGSRLLHGIRRIADAHPAADRITVRGRGLLLGVDLGTPGAVGELFLNLLDRGVLANHSLNASSVVRFTPPAIITDDEAGVFLAAFADALAAVPFG
ncbi:aspartate aminotransferase family protein [Nocardia sp. IFM 10818]